MRARIVSRCAALVTGAVLPLLGNAPALADRLGDGEVRGEPLGTAGTWLIFVGGPLALFAVIALLAVLPQLLSRPRYRPGQPWQHQPLWFAGPEDPDQALRRARPGASAKGGAGADW